MVADWGVSRLRTLMRGDSAQGFIREDTNNPRWYQLGIRDVSGVGPRHQREEAILQKLARYLREKRQVQSQAGTHAGRQASRPSAQSQRKLSATIRIYGLVAVVHSSLRP